MVRNFQLLLIGESNTSRCPTSLLGGKLFRPLYESSIHGSQKDWEKQNKKPPSKQERWTRFSLLSSSAPLIASWNVFALTMFVQALANVIYLGLNCRVLIGPGCLPSNTATFIPLSVLQTWTLPSSEPAQDALWMHCLPKVVKLIQPFHILRHCDHKPVFHQE